MEKVSSRILHELAEVCAAPNRSTTTSADSTAVASSSDQLFRTLDEIKRSTDQVAIEILNDGGAELLLQLIVPQPGQARAAHKIGVIRAVVESLSRLAQVLGYGGLAPSSFPFVERLNRLQRSLDLSPQITLNKKQPGDPLAYALSQQPSPMQWLVEFQAAEQRMPAGTFEQRARKTLMILPLLHASFLFDPAKFMIEALRSGYLEYFVTYCEDLVAVMFLLLPKAIRQQITQEWACILRNTSYPQGVTIPSYEAGWEALTMKVKSLNKFGLDIELVMEVLQQIAHFVYVISVFPACVHEIQKVAATASATAAQLQQSMHFLERVSDYLYHAARCMIRWIPLTKSKASVLLSCLLLVEGTLQSNHPFLESWTFWWQKNWWMDICKRVKNIPTAEVHADIPNWMRFEVTETAKATESLLAGAPVMVEQQRHLKCVEDGCCEMRRALGLKQLITVLINSLQSSSLPYTPGPIQMGGAARVVVGSDTNLLNVGRMPQSGMTQIGSASSTPTLPAPSRLTLPPSPIISSQRSILIQPSMLGSKATVRSGGFPQQPSIPPTRPSIATPLSAFAKPFAFQHGFPEASSLFSPASGSQAGFLAFGEFDASMKLSGSSNRPLSYSPEAQLSLSPSPSLGLDESVDDPLASVDIDSFAAFASMDDPIHLSAALEPSSTSSSHTVTPSRRGPSSPAISRRTLPPDPSIMNLNPMTAAFLGRSFESALNAQTSIGTGSAASKQSCDATSQSLPCVQQLQLKICGGCLKLESFVNEFLVCSGCDSGPGSQPTAYCSSECQRKDWPNHKITCGAWHSNPITPQKAA